ncbi:hypothetical protein RCL1_008009 [Eukaryota sp. TZLM3-RCL]
MGNPLPSHRFSFLPTLKHPCLWNNFHLLQKPNSDVATDFDHFGSLHDLILDQYHFSSDDLWCIFTQLVYLFDFLFKQEFLIGPVITSDVLVISFFPIHIKVSLICCTRFDDNNSLFDDLFDMVLDSVFLEKLLVETLKNFINSFIEQFLQNVSCFSTLIHDVNLIKSIFCSCNSLREFKQNSNILKCVLNYFSFLLLPNCDKTITPLALANSLLYHVFTQGIVKFDKPLVELLIEDAKFACKNTQFSTFATTIINVSSSFRSIFLRCFDMSCKEGGHVVLDSSLNVDCRCILQSSLLSQQIVNYLSPSVFYSLPCKWFSKFPVTFVTTLSLRDMRFDFFLGSTITGLQILYFEGLLPALNRVPNLSYLSIHNISQQYFPSLSSLSSFFRLQSLELHSLDSSFDVSLIGELRQLTSLSLHGFVIDDLSPLSSLENLSSLSLRNCRVLDLLPLQQLANLSFLDLKETTLSREEQ